MVENYSFAQIDWSKKLYGIGQMQPFKVVILLIAASNKKKSNKLA